MVRKTGDGELLFSSLAEDESESVEVHSAKPQPPPLLLLTLLLLLCCEEVEGRADLGFRWMFSFLMVLPRSMSSTYLRKSRSSWKP